MTVQPRLSRSMAWTISGTLVFALSQWGIVSLTAKLAGSVALGRFTLAGAVVAPILALTQVQLRAVLATDARFEHRLRDFLDVRGWLTLAMVVITPLFAVVTRESAATVGVISAFVVAKGLDSLADVLYGYHQRREDMRVIAIGQYINGALSVLLFGGVLYFSRDIVLATVGYAVASGLTLVAWVLPVSVLARRRDAEDPRDQSPARIRLLRAALPLGIVMVLAGIAANLPRYAVESVLGESALGIFGGAAYLVVVGSNVISAVGQAVSPRLAKHAATRSTGNFRRLVTRLLLASFLVGAVGTVVAGLWGGTVLGWLYTAEFARHTDLLVALAAGTMAAFPAVMLAVAATAARNFRAQLPVFVIVLAVGAVACWAFVPAWGLLGAAAAAAVMSVVQLAGFAWIVRSSTRWEDA